ncbi:MAG: GGDEF domain-containing protein [Henriciella sp.]|nr:GGDEF domain-containing protein [Henriciella sp.]
MTAPLAEQQDTDVDYTPRNNAIYQLAGTAFDLIEKHGTPPAPMTYTMWYAYASNSPEAVVQEVDEILDTHGKISGEQIEDIFEAHLSNSKFQDESERVSQAIESSLSEVSDLISKTSSENEAMRGQLEEVGSDLSKRPKRRDISAIFEQLVATNTQMSSMTETLASDLAKSREQVRQLTEEFEVIKKQSRTDALTDVANRRAFNERLAYVHDSAAKNSEDFALALLDLDKFKVINDTFGHPMGDEVLAHLARLIVENMEKNDFAARIGGDEFAIIFPNQSSEQAYHSMMAMKRQLERATIHPDLSRDSRHQVTFSCGITQYGKGQSIEDVIAAADNELMRAKRKSRNFIAVQGRRT